MIKTRRLPLLLFVGAASLKAVLVLLWRLFQPPEVARLLDLDPGAIWLAEVSTSWLFDLRGIAPPPGAALFYEAALILAAGLEGLAAGLLLRFIISWWRKSSLAAGR